MDAADSADVQAVLEWDGDGSVVTEAELRELRKEVSALQTELLRLSGGTWAFRGTQKDRTTILTELVPKIRRKEHQFREIWTTRGIIPGKLVKIVHQLRTEIEIISVFATVMSSSTPCFRAIFTSQPAPMIPIGTKTFRKHQERAAPYKITVFSNQAFILRPEDVARVQINVIRSSQATIGFDDKSHPGLTLFSSKVSSEDNMSFLVDVQATHATKLAVIYFTITLPISRTQVVTTNRSEPIVVRSHSAQYSSCCSTIIEERMTHEETFLGKMNNIQESFWLLCTFKFRSVFEALIETDDYNSVLTANSSTITADLDPMILMHDFKKSESFGIPESFFVPFLPYYRTHPSSWPHIVSSFFAGILDALRNPRNLQMWADNFIFSFSDYRDFQARICRTRQGTVLFFVVPQISRGTLDDMSEDARPPKRFKREDDMLMGHVFFKTAANLPGVPVRNLSGSQNFASSAYEYFRFNCAHACAYSDRQSQYRPLPAFFDKYFPSDKNPDRLRIDRDPFTQAGAMSELAQQEQSGLMPIYLDFAPPLSPEPASEAIFKSDPLPLDNRDVQFPAPDIMNFADDSEAHPIEFEPEFT